MAEIFAGQPPAISTWARMIASVTAFVEAAELGSVGYLEARIVELERRIADLEGDKAASSIGGN
jgi:hypothetical protein